MFDGMAHGAEFAEIVRGYVERATLPLLERIARLEAREPERGEKGDPGLDGKDGESITLEDIAPLVRAAVSAAVAELPAPEKGDPGKDGQDGRDGSSVALADVEPMIREAISSAVAQIEPPKDGRDGEPGLDGKDGEPGEKGDPGPSGIGLADALIDRENNLVLTMTDGSTKALGLVVGRDGKDGRDGIDGQKGDRGDAGFSLDGFDTEMRDGGRTLLLKFVQGDTIETHELGLDTMIYRGVFREGQSYERGDMVTWAGSLWHCDEITTAKPGEGTKSWTLAAKKGRDGKDGKDGEKGEPGKKGDPGANGRNWT